MMTCICFPIRFASTFQVVDRQKIIERKNNVGLAKE